MAFHYLASPYTKYPGGVLMATTGVCRIAAKLIASGVNAFSPIVHSHPMTYHQPDISYDRWMELDLAILDKAQGLIVACLPGWKESKGVRIEIDRAIELGMEIYAVNEDGHFIVPPEDLYVRRESEPDTGEQQYAFWLGQES